jgi:hypothetical protein
MVADIVYILCALTSMSCAVLLLRSYARTRARLLLWSGLCFSFFALNNILLFIDLTVLPMVDLSILRTLTGIIGVVLLIFGFIMDERTRV